MPDEPEPNKQYHAASRLMRFDPAVGSVQGACKKILSRVARQLPLDWLSRYGYAPPLLETFVEIERHRGICYKAANWIHVGRTSGRGKKFLDHKPLIPLKDVWQGVFVR